MMCTTRSQTINNYFSKLRQIIIIINRTLTIGIAAININ